MRRLPVADVAYAAALIDNLAAFRSRFSTEGTELPILAISGRYGGLQWLGELTGTKVVETRRKFTRHNCTEHCPQAHSQIQSTSARWTITGMRAVIVLRNVEPFLRAQAAEARRLIDMGDDIRYHGSVVNDMAVLGWEVPDLAPHRRARVSLALA